MKVLISIMFLLCLFSVSHARKKYPHDGLFTDIQYSSRSNYMSYCGLLRFGLWESSRTHNWVDRKDVDHYLDIEEKLKKLEGW